MDIFSKKKAKLKATEFVKKAKKSHKLKKKLKSYNNGSPAVITICFIICNKFLFACVILQKPN